MIYISKTYILMLKLSICTFSFFVILYSQSLGKTIFYYKSKDYVYEKYILLNEYGGCYVF